MKLHHGLFLAGLAWIVVSCGERQGKLAPPASVQTFEVKGTIKELKTNGVTAIIQHEAITNYMETMTMPLRQGARTNWPLSLLGMW